MKYTITIITDMPDDDARVMISAGTRELAEALDYAGEFTTTIVATAVPTQCIHCGVQTFMDMDVRYHDGHEGQSCGELSPDTYAEVGEAQPFSAYMLNPAESSTECIVVPGVDGPTMWDCTCEECERLQDEYHDLVDLS